MTPLHLLPCIHPCLLAVAGATAQTQDLPAQLAGLNGVNPAQLQVLTASPALMLACHPGAVGAGCLVSRGDVRLAFEGRLDNRDDIRRRLDLPPEARLSDAELVCAAYGRWGESFPEQLVGEFACILHDVRSQALLAVRDAMGRRPLFWARWQGGFLLASSPQAILATPGFPRRLNRAHLALMVSPLASLLMASDDTCYEGIFQVPAATVLRLGPDEVRARRYWRPDPEARLSIPDADVPDALRELLFRAVADRLPATGPAMALLSGGLDSSGLTAIAATLLRRQNRQLVTLSAVSASDVANPFADERAYIDQFAGWDNIEQVHVEARGRGPFDDLDLLLGQTSSPMLTSRHYLYSAFAEAAQARGGQRLLDGVGGEMGPTCYADGYLPELFVTGHWRRLSHELRACMMREPALPRRHVISNFLLWPLLPLPLVRALGRAGKAQLGTATPLASDFLAAQLPVTAAQLFERIERTLRPGPDHRVNQARLMEVLSRSDGLADRFVGQQGLQLDLPYADQRVLEFCLAAPGHWKMRDGHTRYLIRSALAGLLPPAIQWRTSKEPFSPDFQLRYNRQRGRVADWLAGIPGHDPVREIVDVDRLALMALHEMQTNNSSSAKDYETMHLVPLGVYLIRFLRQFGA